MYQRRHVSLSRASVYCLELAVRSSTLGIGLLARPHAHHRSMRAPISAMHAHRALDPLRKMTVILLGIALLLLASPASVAAHSQRSNTQRAFLASHPSLYADDIDGDGVDDWLLTDVSRCAAMRGALSTRLARERDARGATLTARRVSLSLHARQGASLYVTASDYLAIGKAYTRAPFSVAGTPIGGIVSGSFLGRTQPRVLCAYAYGNATSPFASIACGILHPQQYRVQWILAAQTMTFDLNRSGTIGVDLLVADANGDGVGQSQTASTYEMA
jgi:hypothetical protein